MPLDPSIILSGRGPQFDSPLDIAQKGISLRQMTLQNQAMEKQSADQNSMNEILKKNASIGADGSVSINRGAAMSDLYSVNPQKAMEFQKYLQAQDLDTLKAHTELAKNLSFSATPENWTQIKEKAVSLGLPNTDKLPDTYSPEFVQRWQVSTLNGEEQVKKMHADKELTVKQDHLNLEKDKFDFDKSKQPAVKQKEAAEIASSLRKERSMLPTTKATQEVAVAFNKIQSSLKNPSPAGDMALVFNYMKMLDPGSTVREGEYATAQNATGVPGQVLNAYNRALKGESLNPDQRKDFSGQAGKLYKAQLQVQQQIDSQYSTLAKKSGIDPKDVLLNFEANNSEQPKTFKTKDIEWAD